MTDVEDSKMTSDCKAGWMPIDTAPRDGTAVLLFTESGKTGVGCSLAICFDGLNFNEDNAAYVWKRPGDNKTSVHMPSGSWDEVTHWMPLPPPPNND